MFQVRTLDGRLVWRRRHYRVRRAERPGTFHFSVLDNGGRCIILTVGFADACLSICKLCSVRAQSLPYSQVMCCQCAGAGVISKEYWRYDHDESAACSLPA